MSNQNKLLFVLTLAAIAVIGTFAFRTLPRHFKTAPTEKNSDVPQTPQVLPTDQKRGAANGTKTIIEFGDMECPYCASINPQIKTLIEQKQNVRFVWKDCPLPNHPNAQMAAEAAQCAGDEGKYWEYQEKLMQNNDRLGSELYSEIATSIGLNTEKFSTCLSKGFKRDRVKASLSECAAAGVTELPWFYMNGKNYSGGNIIYELNTDLNK